jgi:hypothetical protein
MLFNNIENDNSNVSISNVLMKILEGFDIVLMLDTVIDRLEEEIKINLIKLIQIISITDCSDVKIQQNILEFQKLIQIANKTNWISSLMLLNTNYNKISEIDKNHECSNLNTSRFNHNFQGNYLSIKNENAENCNNSLKDVISDLVSRFISSENLHFPFRDIRNSKIILLIELN